MSCKLAIYYNWAFKALAPTFYFNSELCWRLIIKSLIIHKPALSVIIWEQKLKIYFARERQESGLTSGSCGSCGSCISCSSFSDSPDYLGTIIQVNSFMFSRPIYILNIVTRKMTFHFKFFFLPMFPTAWIHNTHKYRNIKALFLMWTCILERKQTK